MRRGRAWGACRNGGATASLFYEDDLLRRLGPEKMLKCIQGHLTSFLKAR